MPRPPLNYEPPIDVPPQPTPPPAPKPPPAPWWRRLALWLRQEYQVLTGKRW